MWVRLQWRWEVVTGLCGDSCPVKPTNVMVIPLPGCSKTAIMKNTREDNIKWLLYILRWRLVDTKVGWQRRRRQGKALVLLIESPVKSSRLAARLASFIQSISHMHMHMHTHAHMHTLTCRDSLQWIPSESVLYVKCICCLLCLVHFAAQHVLHAAFIAISPPKDNNNNNKIPRSGCNNAVEKKKATYKPTLKEYIVT